MSQPTPADLLSRVQALSTDTSEESLAELQQLAAHTDKQVVKAAKRSLFLLQQRGIKLPEMKPTPRTVPTEALSTKARPDRAWLSSVSANGRQMLLLVYNSELGGAMESYQYRWSDSEGLIEVKPFRIKESELVEFVEHVNNDPRDVLALAPVEAALARLSQVEKEQNDKKLRFPQGFRDSIKRIGGLPTAPGEPLIRQLLDVEAVRNDATIGSDATPLFECHAIVGWGLSAESLSPCFAQLKEISESTLELSEAQKNERIERVFADSADGLLQNWMGLFQRRLEETALAFHFVGKDDWAKFALKHALLKPEDGKASEWPFAVAFIKHSVSMIVAYSRHMAQQQAEAEAEGTSAT